MSNKEKKIQLSIEITNKKQGSKRIWNKSIENK